MVNQAYHFTVLNKMGGSITLTFKKLHFLIQKKSCNRKHTFFNPSSLTLRKTELAYACGLNSLQSFPI